MSATLLGALAGFFGALVTLGIPVAKWMHGTREDARLAVRLLTGEEQMQGDGVIPRLRNVEQRSIEHRIALQEEGIEVPELDEDRPVRADGEGREEDGPDPIDADPWDLPGIDYWGWRRIDRVLDRSAFGGAAAGLLLGAPLLRGAAVLADLFSRAWGWPWGELGWLIGWFAGSYLVLLGIAHWHEFDRGDDRHD